jgi:hypothetical protein
LPFVDITVYHIFQTSATDISKKEGRGASLWRADRAKLAFLCVKEPKTDNIYVLFFVQITIEKPKKIVYTIF